MKKRNKEESRKEKERAAGGEWATAKVWKREDKRDLEGQRREQGRDGIERKRKIKREIGN